MISLNVMSTLKIKKEIIGIIIIIKEDTYKGAQ